MKSSFKDLNSEVHKTTFQTHYIENGIYFSKFNESVKGLNLEIAKQIIKEHKDLIQDKILPAFLDVGKIIWIPVSVMQYFENHGKDNISKLAIMINSPSTKMLANLYLKLFNPIIPTELFTNSDEAIKWLAVDC